MSGDARIGISGWNYQGWRGVFYPKGLTHRRELEFASRAFNSIEINGSFYSLQLPSSYQRWHAETPDGFLFSVKGPRFITHMKKLREVEAPLANFFASGVLALKEKLGSVLWQFPPNFGWNPQRFREFFELLPKSAAEAALLGRRHNEKLKTRAFLKTAKNYPLRYCVEVRHASFLVSDFFRSAARIQCRVRLRRYRWKMGPTPKTSRAILFIAACTVTRSSTPAATAPMPSIGGRCD